MASFTLNTSTLASEQFFVAPFTMDGEFRDVLLHFYQTGADQDMEVHYLEIHYTVTGVSQELL